MTTSKILAAALIAGSTLLTIPQSVIAAPLMNSAAPLSGVSSSTSNVENVRYYGRRGYYRGGGYRHGGGGAGLGLGLAAGAIIGGAIAASAAQANQNASYCAQRYRSYDPASGTYLNNDGNRYPCP